MNGLASLVKAQLEQHGAEYWPILKRELRKQITEIEIGADWARTNGIRFKLTLPIH